MTTYTYDAANRLVNAGGVPYTWNANGNLLSDGSAAYAYDFANTNTSRPSPEGSFSLTGNRADMTQRLSNQQAICTPATNGRYL